VPHLIPAGARRLIRWRSLWLLAVSAVAITCDAPTSVGRMAFLALQPVYNMPADVRFAGLAIDSARIFVIRPPADTIKRRTIRFAPDADTLEATFEIELAAPSETFQVTLQLLAAGQIVFQGTQAVTVDAGTVAGTPPKAQPVTLSYTGPGAGVASLAIVPRDSGVTLGGTAQFGVVARDSQNAVLAQYYVGWRTNSAVHSIDANGLFRAGNARGRVMVWARAPNGTSDSTSMFVVPVPATISAVGGNGQTGPGGLPLPTQLAARVLAADNLPVGGVTVAFAAATGGGSVLPTTAVTDSLGIARTTATLGATVGGQTFTASVPGTTITPATFGATATSPGQPVIVLSIPDTIVGVGFSPALQVTLLQAAPTGGLVVTVISDSTQYLTVAAPGTIAFNAGETVRTIGITGVALGIATVRATAPGYTPDTLFVPVIPPFLSLPAATNVGVTQSTQVTVTALPRAVGALAVTLVSSDPAIVSVTTPNVTIPAGQATVNATLQGVAAGTAVVTATAAGYLQGATVVTVGTGGVPATLTKTAGDNQTAIINDTVAVRPRVRVLDVGGAPVAGVSVLFQVASGGGSITGTPSGVSDVNGFATLGGTWRMGATPITNTLTASIPLAPTVPAVTFNATAVPPPPVIQLSIFGSNVVGQARTGTLNVRLLQAAPAGGLTVNLVTTRPGLLRIGTYTSENGSAAFAQGDTLKTVTVFGDSVVTGVDTVIATAPGYTSDTLAVPISLNLISLPTTANVPLSQNTSLPVNLSVAAQAGGLRVAVQSSNPAVVQVLTDTVVIAAGSRVGSATVRGAAIGSTTVTATNPNYAPDLSTVSVTASLNITAATISLNASFGSPITIQLESGGLPVGAPAGGVPVTITSRDPTCAVAPNGTISQGFVNTSVIVTYGGTAPLPCSAFIVASGPPGFTIDSVNAFVAVQPGISIGTVNVGSGLQRFIGGSLGASNHGGTTVQITSPDTNIVRLSFTDSTPGTATINIPVPVGQSSFSYYVQGMEGRLADTVTLSAAAPAFVSASPAVRVWQPVLDLIGVPGSVNTLSGPSNLYVRPGTPASPTGTFMNTNDAIRAGGVPLTARVSVTDSTVARLADTATATTRADTAYVQILPRQFNSPTTLGTGGAQLQYLSAGVDTARATAAGYRSISTALNTVVTVSAPSLSVSTLNVASGLQRPGSVSMSAAAPAGGVTIVLRAAPTGKVLLSATASTVGADSLVLTLAQGQSTVPGGFYAQSLEGFTADTVTLTATAVAPGFTAVTPGTGQVRIWQPVLDLIGVPGSVNTLSGPSNLYVRPGTPSSPTGTFMNTNDAIRAGGVPITARISVTDTTVARLADTATAATRGDTAYVQILPGQFNSPTTLATGGAQLQYLAAGVDTVRATAAGYRAISTALNDVVTISAPSLSVSTLNVASGLQRPGSVSMTAAAPAGGVTIVLRAAPTGKVLLSANDSTAGADTLVLTLAQGQSSVPGGFYAQSLEGFTADTVTLTATAVSPGFTAVTPATGQVRIWQPVVDLIGVPTSVNTFTTNTVVYARLGTPSSPTGTFMNTNDAVRAGATPVVVSFESNQSTVVQVETNTLTGDSVTAVIQPRQFNTPTTRALGGVELNYVSTGQAVVTALAPPARRISTALGDTVTVSPPVVSISNNTVGAGLQLFQGGSLSAANHGGVTVVVTSSNPAVLRISANDSTPGTDSIVINVLNNQGSFGYYLQGIEGATGTVIITATATGFTPDNATITVAQPAFDVIGVQTSGISAATTGNNAFYVRVGYGNAPSNTFLQSNQAVRAGGPTLTVTINTSNPAVATLVTQAGPQGGQATVQILPRQFNSPTTVATGGVAQDFLTAGITNISASITGFDWAQSSKPIVVNVGP